MANIFSQISPIESVKIRSAKGVQLQLPELVELPVLFEPIRIFVAKGVEFPLARQTDLSQTLEIEFPNSPIPIEAELPVNSLISSILLLFPEETEKLPDLPLGYHKLEVDSQDELTLSIDLLTPLNSDEQETDDLFRDQKLYAVKSKNIPLEIFKTSDVVQVSENLLDKLLPPRTVSGMLYADRYWTREKVPEYFANKGNKTNKNNKRNPVNPKDLHAVGGVKVSRPRFMPSFWDLIFVLLQPPLVFGKTESLLLPHDLFPYQIEGVKFLMSNEHALLADDMGTGKTVMSTVALKLLLRSGKIKKVLILCPPSVLYEWKRHIADWFPEAIACFVRGTQDIRSMEWKTPAHIYITTYDTLRSDVENGLLSSNKWGLFDVIIVDEAHHIKNSNTSRSKAIKKLKPKYRWALTGTPIQNKIEDMAALFDFLFPNYITPYDLYEEKLMKKVAPYFLRRRKQDVLKDLPPKIKQDIWLELSDEQRSEYDRAEKEIQSEIEGLGSNVTRQHIFAKLQRLKQICNFPSGRNTSPKLEALKEQVEDISESGNKIIVFSQYVDEGVKKLVAALKSYGVATIVGGQSDLVRRLEIEKFKHLDKTSVLVASVKSGGEGLNLTEASYVVHFDHWWNPAVMWQAEDRVHRRGQKQNVNVYSYWMTETIDERIFEILKRKGLLIQNVVDGLSEDTVDELISMDELFEIIGVRIPKEEKPVFDPRKWQAMDLDLIEQRLFDISPREFEELVERLMHYLGFPNVKVTKRTGDGGIDVLSTRITEKGVDRIAAQCKRYRQPVGVAIAREFCGAIEDDKMIIKGYLVTTSDFSSECITYCIRHNIDMIPGKKIAEYVKQFGLEI